MKRAYDSQKDLKEDAILQLRCQRTTSKLMVGPLQLDVTFYMPIGASYSLKKKNALLDKPHSSRPDLSNLIKFLEDVAQGVLFRDDSQIHTINARKIYSTNTRTEFYILEERDEEATEEETGS